MVCVVDYGVGNLASIKNMLKKIGVDCMISSSEFDILAADKLILPGVGAFDTCVEKLNESGLRQVLEKKVLVEKAPVLGICVGMQLLLSESEEGHLQGLGWIRGKNIRFDSQAMLSQLKIPHMGWTDVCPAKPSRLLQQLEDEPRFYFVHSYHAKLEEDADGLLYADYGYRFIAGVEKENIMGVQFHPEKSHKYGMRLLQNFVKNY